MLNQFRIVLSAVVTVGVLISTVAFTPSKAQACPIRIPSTLLSLYLQSDLIVVADLENENETKRTSETKHGYYANLERSLRISKILKGNREDASVSYKTFEYRSKARTKKNGLGLRRGMFGRFGYGIPLTIGNQYLFFLRKNGENYNLADDMASVKKIDASFEIYEERIDKLESIVANKDNQVENLTEWLVKGVEEPLTRWGSIQDIYSSSNYLESELRYPKNRRDQKFVLGKGFRAYTSAIAKSLTDSQKARISAVLNASIQESWFGEKAERVDYRLVRIVRGWDKIGLATNAFTVLQGLDDSNLEKKKLVMEFISNIADDNKLRNSYYQHSSFRNGGSKQTQIRNAAMRLKKLNEFNTRFQFLLMRNFEPIAKK